MNFKMGFQSDSVLNTCINYVVVLLLTIMDEIRYDYKIHIFALQEWNNISLHGSYRLLLYLS